MMMMSHSSELQSVFSGNGWISSHEMDMLGMRCEIGWLLAEVG